MTRTMTRAARQGSLFNADAGPARREPLIRNQHEDAEPQELGQDIEPLEASFLPDEQLSPRCPHCHCPFPTWSRAKIHVKHCRAGRPRQTVAQRIARSKVSSKIKSGLDS